MSEGICVLLESKEPKTRKTAARGHGSMLIAVGRRHIIEGIAAALENKQVK